jgi:hypothetical protein
MVMRTSLPVALLLVACTRPNPGYNADATATAAESTGGPSVTSGPPAPTTGAVTTATTTDASTSTGPSDPTQAIDSESSGSSTSGATTADLTTSNNETSSDTGDATTVDPDTGSSGDTGAPMDCWPQGAAGWPEDGMKLDKFADVEPGDPFITPDATRIYYVALSPRRVFVSDRGGDVGEFPNGKQLGLWPGSDVEAGYPQVVLDGQEMLLSSKNDVYSAEFVPAMGEFAKPAMLPVASAGEVSVITATSDGQLLVVARNDGPAIPPLFPKTSFRFHQFMREVPKPGGDFVDAKLDVTPTVAPLGMAICPTLSPDGLRMFFGSTDAATLDAMNVDDVVGIWYTTRPARDKPWATPAKTGIKHEGQGITCPSSVTADGCQLAFHRFLYGQGKYAMFVATRAP